MVRADKSTLQLQINNKCLSYLLLRFIYKDLNVL